MTAFKEDIEAWKKRGRRMNATHIISVCDTFDYDDYPVFVMPGDSLEEKKKECTLADMHKINEVIEL